VIRAYVQENYTGFSVAVSVVMHPQEGSYETRPRILRLGTRDRTQGWEEIPDPNGAIEPTFTLGPDEARAVLDALTVHYHGAEDTRALRRDYDHERGRVDGLIRTVSTIAASVAER
jgi:hypothetical protein